MKKRGQKKKAGGVSDSWLDVRKRGGHSDAHCVQKGEWGVYKLRKDAYVLNGRPPEQNRKFLDNSLTEISHVMSYPEV